MNNFFTRGPGLSGPSLLQVALLGTGLALSVGSVGKSKKPNLPVIIFDSQCRTSRPDSFKQMLDRYSLSCRYNGGIPTFKYVTKRSEGGVTCPNDMLFHGIAIGCDGASFDRKMIPAVRPAVAELPTTAEAKSAMMKAILDGHNGYRAAMKLKPLVWYDRLAELAEKWANHLASLGGKRLVRSKVRGQGENIWMGPASTFSYATVLKSWNMQAEQRAQMMNSKASKIGCFFRRTGKNIIGVCRYWPPMK